MTLQSPAFKHNQPIPAKYTCDGDDVSPPLKLSGVPEQTKSLVLIVDDPDAPGKTFVHWTVWNIDPKTTEIPENSLSEGAVEGQTDFDRTGWGGPCPPSGTHRYFFKLYALDTEFDFETTPAKKDLEAKMQNHILDQTELIGLYRRV